MLTIPSSIRAQLRRSSLVCTDDLEAMKSATTPISATVSYSIAVVVSEGGICDTKSGLSVEGCRENIVTTSCKAQLEEKTPAPPSSSGEPTRNPSCSVMIRPPQQNQVLDKARYLKLHSQIRGTGSKVKDFQPKKKILGCWTCRLRNEVSWSFYARFIVLSAKVLLTLM